MFALLALQVSASCAQFLVDTIGFTTRDRQMYGPSVRYLVNDTLSGVHAVWKGDYSDIRYNFRPRGGVWRWPGGRLVNSEPRDLGSLDVDVSNGCAMLSTDYLWRNQHVLTWMIDSSSGSGVFWEIGIEGSYRHSLIGAANYGYTKFAVLRDDSVCYRAYLGDYPLGHVGAFPAFNLAVSKQSGRYGFIWAETEGDDRGTLFLKQTPNNGQNWFDTQRLSDSVPSLYNRSLLSGCGTYDTIRLHLVTDFYDGADPSRSELWHYCPYQTPAWHFIHSAALPQTAGLGDWALAACRPTVGLNRALGEAYVVWEEFDAGNVDPLTGLCRADIWAARSPDTGLSWGPAVRLTLPDSTSKRFPFLAEVVDDTLHILYFADRVAGFSEQGQGPQTTNAVVCLRVPVVLLPSAARERDREAWRYGLQVSPSVSSSGFSIKFPAGPCAGPVTILDAAGRMVGSPARSIHPGETVLWGTNARPGVYFIRCDGSTVRVVRTR